MDKYDIFLSGFFVGGAFISCVRGLQRWAQEKARKRGYGLYARNGKFVWKNEYDDR